MSYQVHSETSFLPLQYKGLTKELRYKAEKELNETEDTRENALEDLREFIENENLPRKLDDEILLQFLRVAKFKLKDCQERLKKYCILRGKEEFVEMFDEEGIMSIIDSNILGLLPYRDSHGAAVMYNIASVWNSKVCNEKNLSATHYALGEFALSFPPTSVSGINYLINASTDYPRRTLTDISTYKNNAYDMLAYPVRLKSVVVVQANTFIRFCYSAIRHFLPTKVTSRMHIQKETEISMPGIFHPSILPSEFGGTMGPVSNEHFKDDFQRFLKKMQSENSMFYDSDN